MICHRIFNKYCHLVIKKSFFYDILSKIYTGIKFEIDKLENLCLTKNKNYEFNKKTKYVVSIDNG